MKKNAPAGKRPTNVDVYVGERLKAIRKERGLSQADVGKLLGVTFQQVQKYEKGHNRMTVSRLAWVAQELGVPITEFLP